MLTLQFAEARTGFTKLYNSVVKGNAAVVERRGSPAVALIERDELDKLLAEHHSFEPQVAFDEEGGAEMWLEELPVHAQGKDFEAAGHSLVEALISYSQLWEDELQHAPNHKDNAGWVRRVQLRGGDHDELFRLIFEG